MVSVLLKCVEAHEILRTMPVIRSQECSLIRGPLTCSQVIFHELTLTRALLLGFIVADLQKSLNINRLLMFPTCPQITVTVDVNLQWILHYEL